MRAAFLLGSILLALSASRGPLQWYFAAQLAYTLSGLLAIRVFGVEGDAYTLVWAAGTGLVLAASCRLVGRVRMGIAATGSLLGAGLGILSLYGTPKPWVASDWVNVGTGTALVGLAWCLPKRDATNVILSLLWLTLATWSFGFPMHWKLETWRRLNWVIPTWACVTAFTWIGGRAWIAKWTVSRG